MPQTFSSMFIKRLSKYLSRTLDQAKIFLLEYIGGYNENSFILLLNILHQFPLKRLVLNHNFLHIFVHYIDIGPQLSLLLVISILVLLNQDGNTSHFDVHFLFRKNLLPIIVLICFRSLCLIPIIKINTE